MDGAKLRIGGMVYTVDEQDTVEIAQDRNHAGACDVEHCRIELLRDLVEQRKAQVLVHEICHAMLTEAGIEEHEESFVNVLGNALHQLLRDNDIRGILGYE